MENTLPRDAAFDLDYNMGLINMEIETLFGVKDLLDDIKYSMDEAEIYGQNAVQRIYVHRRLNAIIELIRHSLKDLGAAHMDANQNKDVLFDYLVKGKERESFSNKSQPKEVKEMISEREREVVMKHNTISFTHTFNREPVNEQEVTDWVSRLTKK